LKERWVAGMRIVPERIPYRNGGVTGKRRPLAVNRSGIWRVSSSAIWRPGRTERSAVEDPFSGYPLSTSAGDVAREAVRSYSKAT